MTSRPERILPSSRVYIAGSAPNPCDAGMGTKVDGTELVILPAWTNRRALEDLICRVGLDCVVGELPFHTVVLANKAAGAKRIAVDPTIDDFSIERTGSTPDVAFIKKHALNTDITSLEFVVECAAAESVHQMKNMNAERFDAEIMHVIFKAAFKAEWQADPNRAYKEIGEELVNKGAYRKYMHAGEEYIRERNSLARGRFESSQESAAQARVNTADRYVWKGRMSCDSCGYGWQSRRDKPPARCPRCGQRNLTAQVTRKWGCAILVMACVGVAVSCRLVFAG